MRRACVVMAGLALAGCGKVSDDRSPGESVTSARGVAFAYDYALLLPSARIAAVQEVHAQACERLTAARCRITGMSYRVDAGGAVDADLALSIDPAAARVFGRQAAQNAEAAGGVLAGVEITGTDTQPAAEAAIDDAASVRSDVGDIDAQLARSDLPSETRGRLLERRLALRTARRAGAQAAVRAVPSSTPVRFTYRAGSVGLYGRIADAWAAAYGSFVWTLASLLLAFAYLGPPLAVIALLALAWHRLGRRWWRRLFPPDAE